VGAAATTKGEGKSGAVVGGAVGGATGAAVGQKVGGGSGAVVGSGVGAAAGATIGKNVTEEDRSANTATRRVEPVRSGPPPVVVRDYRYDDRDDDRHGKRSKHKKHKPHPPGHAYGHDKHDRD
jgi:uncharacterized protein YcfJ